MNQIIVIGAGAAGLMAGGWAAHQGADVVILDRKEKAGKKLRISGKGRCNITNAADLDEFFQFYPGNGKFLYGALHRFSNQDVCRFFAENGVPVKVERGKRVFPVNDDADSVADALVGFARRGGAQLRFNTEVTAVERAQDHFQLQIRGQASLAAKSIILAAGGASYPYTGSNGSGFRLAEQLGHRINPPFPALVPLRTKEKWVREVAGLSLRNVATTVSCGASSQSDFGEMLFTHFGVSGPNILTLSRQVSEWIRQGKQPIELHIDLKPALDLPALDRRIQRDFDKYSRKMFRNSLSDLLPASLIPVVVELSGIDGDKPTNQISRQERRRLAELLKDLKLTVTDTLPLAAAIVTAGGIAVNEVNPQNMESRLVPGLYFAGEVLDVDGVTGGFNLQAAFSTGYVAGLSAAGREE